MAEQVDANQLGIANGACCRVYKTRVKQVVSLHQESITIESNPQSQLSGAVSVIECYVECKSLPQNIVDKPIQVCYNVITRCSDSLKDRTGGYGPSDVGSIPARSAKTIKCWCVGIGRRGRLKICCLHWRMGSSPITSTNQKDLYL